MMETEMICSRLSGTLSAVSSMQRAVQRKKPFLLGLGGAQETPGGDTGPVVRPHLLVPPPPAAACGRASGTRCSLCSL